MFNSKLTKYYYLALLFFSNAAFSMDINMNPDISPLAYKLAPDSAALHLEPISKLLCLIQPC